MKNVAKDCSPGYLGCASDCAGPGQALEIGSSNHSRLARRRRRATSRRVAFIVFAAVAASAAASLDPPAWTRSIAPFHLVGPIWYVGTEGLAAYLIKTREGAILLDATMAENVPAVERSIRAVGVPLERVKLLLVSHAHFDHAAGDAAMVRATGAKVVAGAGDVAALESGTPPGETNYGVIRFLPVKVTRAVRDGDRVTLGGVTLTAVSTPGHTPGCTSWTTRVVERGRMLDVVFPCSVSVAGNRLIGNRRYPGIVADYRASIARLGRLKADVVLPFHPELADVQARAVERRLVAPDLLGALARRARVDFDAEYARQGKDAR